MWLSPIIPIPAFGIGTGREKKEKGKENNYAFLNYFVFRKMQDSESFSDNHGFPLISTTSTSMWPPGMTMTLIWWQGPKTLSKCFNNRCRRPCHFIKNVMKNQKYKLLSIFFLFNTFLTRYLPISSFRDFWTKQSWNLEAICWINLPFSIYFHFNLKRISLFILNCLSNHLLHKEDF